MFGFIVFDNLVPNTVHLFLGNNVQPLHGFREEVRQVASGFDPRPLQKLRCGRGFAGHPLVRENQPPVGGEALHPVYDRVLPPRELLAEFLVPPHHPLLHGRPRAVVRHALLPLVQVVAEAGDGVPGIPDEQDRPLNLVCPVKAEVRPVIVRIVRLDGHGAAGVAEPFVPRRDAREGLDEVPDHARARAGVRGGEDGGAEVVGGEDGGP
mmetsp:Transcript_35186/g.105096  ORF Transcript_35186/g.105096 Transcript_35186/m.105096 type:complete len:209 (+) Transcript_35186:361-987(+)